MVVTGRAAATAIDKHFDRIRRTEDDQRRFER